MQTVACLLTNKSRLPQAARLLWPTEDSSCTRHQIFSLNIERDKSALRETAAHRAPRRTRVILLSICPGVPSSWQCRQQQIKFLRSHLNTQPLRCTRAANGAIIHWQSRFCVDCSVDRFAVAPELDRVAAAEESEAPDGTARRSRTTHHHRLGERSRRPPRARVHPRKPPRLHHSPCGAPGDARQILLFFEGQLHPQSHLQERSLRVHDHLLGSWPGQPHSQSSRSELLDVRSHRPAEGPEFPR